MTRLAYLLLLLGLLCHSQGNASTKEATDPVLQPIFTLFDAMRTHNSALFLAQFADNARLQRVEADGSIKNSDLNRFASFVEQSQQHLDEQLFNIQLHRQHQLAVAWTPFMFYLDGKLSHCGVNTFQLVEQAGQWKIIALVDEAYQGDCTTFKQTLEK